ncbi:hypothetical protein SADUNF_Sadunf16G0107500 [Salix dunnii]|uniref:Leucine-rich repeat-containing N-terminal plant-type domain-containing protein n=1 Tax=Salix dunnii TaxID=1413687 RepID=A0A835J919_9ROSI|nr:hypothetical protein SADUNF_Sadunf16G0107500 [Salix dunnii]
MKNFRGNSSESVDDIGIIMNNFCSFYPPFFILEPVILVEEGYALLPFKESLVINESASSDPSAYPKVASWKVDGESGDCCSWDRRC